MNEYVPAPPTKFVFHTQLKKGEVYYIRRNPIKLEPVRWAGRTAAGYNVFYYTDPELRQRTGHLSIQDHNVVMLIQEHYNKDLSLEEYVAQGGRW